jgi:hypothetical protein
MGSDKETQMIAAVIASFPTTFQLRAHEGTFRISLRNSYFRGPGECGGELMLYTQRLLEPEEYRQLYGYLPNNVEDFFVDFCKGTESELRRNVR